MTASLFDILKCMLIGFGTCFKKDAKKCSCSFYSGPNVSKVGPTIKGNFLNSLTLSFSSACRLH